MNKDELLEHLRNPRNAAEHLNPPLDNIELDEQAFTEALRDVAEAHNFLRKTVEPTLRGMFRILHKAGLRMVIETIKEPPA